MATFSPTITFEAANPLDAQVKEEAVKQLLKNLDSESLRILGSKAGKPGVNAKIKQFQHFI